MEEKISRIEADIVSFKNDMATKEDIRVLFAEGLAKIIESRRDQRDQPPT